MINLDKEKKFMIDSGKVSSNILEIIKKYIKPGITTNKINDICDKLMKKFNSKSAILNYMNFPKSICTSINDVVCHGVPDETILKNGDIINIDVSIVKNGFYSDTSKMFMIGNVNKLCKKICYIAKKSLYLAIKNIKPGIKLSVIGKVIQKFVEKNNFSVVRDFCGHGIGKKLHEYPNVLHYYSPDQDKIILEPGMCITIEPMINSGSHEVYIDSDNWTVKTKDKGISAQYEHTLIITNDKVIVTTLRKNEVIE